VCKSQSITTPALAIKETSRMRKLLAVIFLLTQLTFALDRQPNTDYRMRRQALASRANAVVLVFAPRGEAPPAQAT